MKTIKKFLRLFNSVSKKYKIYYSVYSAASIINSLIFVVIPFYSKSIIDKIVRYSFPSNLILVYVLLTLAGYLSIRLWSLNNIRIKEIMKKNLSDETFSDILRMKGETFYSRGSGYWTSVLSTDVNKASTLFLDFVYTIPAEIVMFIGILFIIFIYSKTVFLLILICSLFFAFLVYLREKYIVAGYEMAQERFRTSKEFLNSFLTGFEDLVHFNAGEFFKTKYLTNLNSYEREIKKYILKNNLNGFLTGFVSKAGEVAAIGLALYYFTKSGYSFGTAIMIIMFSGMVFEKMGYIVKNLIWLQNLETHVDKINFIRESDKLPTFSVKPGKFEKIVLDKICFSYGEKQILRYCSMIIGSKEKIALLGLSGAGKSTLIKIIGGFLEPDRGILRFEKTQPKIGLLFQGGRLFNRTLKENLLVAKPNANREELIGSIKKAGLYGWFLNLPNGLETPVGQSGKLISGGEQSRIALARLILFDPEVVLLDEPLSGVDKGKREEIIRNMNHFLYDKTVIVVTHEKDLLRLTDRKVFLEKGELIWNE